MAVADEERDAVECDQGEGDALFGSARRAGEQEGDVEERQGDARPEPGGGERAGQKRCSEHRPVCGGRDAVTSGV